MKTLLLNTNPFETCTLTYQRLSFLRLHLSLSSRSCCLNICIHIVIEDFKREPQSYSECFKIMKEKGICDCAKDLIAITRLRNLLTHRYWTIDDAQVYDSIKKDFKCVDKFLRSVREKYAANI